jgi:hypothetical protein
MSLVLLSARYTSCLLDCIVCCVNSNGSGKSSLAISTLWALTGTLYPRPMQDAKVSDVVNDGSKVSAMVAALDQAIASCIFAQCVHFKSQSARASVRGFLNDKPFVITRTKTSTKGSWIFHLDARTLRHKRSKTHKQS